MGKLQKKKTILLTRNQLLLLDTLMESGGEKKFLDSKKHRRFSEYSGLIDIFKGKIDKIIINVTNYREDDDDNTILLPNDMKDIIRYFYIFHTHPPTPIIGARVSEGILYEFPSISDLYHFAYYHNNGLALGSIIMAPEGVYIIYATDEYIECKIEYPKRTLGEQLEKIQFKIQEAAIKKYGLTFSKEYFYSTISQDRTFYNAFKSAIKKIFKNQITISYVSRTYDDKSDKWLIDKLYLKYN